MEKKDDMSSTTNYDCSMSLEVGGAQWQDKVDVIIIHDDGEIVPLTTDKAERIKDICKLFDENVLEATIVNVQIVGCAVEIGMFKQITVAANARAAAATATAAAAIAAENATAIVNAAAFNAATDNAAMDNAAIINGAKDNAATGNVIPSTTPNTTTDTTPSTTPNTTPNTTAPSAIAALRVATDSAVAAVAALKATTASSAAATEAIKATTLAAIGAMNSTASGHNNKAVVIYHDTVLFTCSKKNKDKFFFTLEKISTGIVMQVANKEESIRNSLVDGNNKTRMRSRRSPYGLPLEMDFCQSDWSVDKVIDWLLEKGEHRRTYNVLFDSCHHFARRLFETTAKTKGYPDKLKLSKIILGSVLKAESHAKLKRDESMEEGHPKIVLGMNHSTFQLPGAPVSAVQAPAEDLSPVEASVPSFTANPDFERYFVAAFDLGISAQRSDLANGPSIKKKPRIF